MTKFSIKISYAVIVFLFFSMSGITIAVLDRANKGYWPLLYVIKGRSLLLVSVSRNKKDFSRLGVCARTEEACAIDFRFQPWMGPRRRKREGLCPRVGFQGRLARGAAPIDFPDAGVTVIQVMYVAVGTWPVTTAPVHPAHSPTSRNIDGFTAIY